MLNSVVMLLVVLNLVHVVVQMMMHDHLVFAR